MNLLDHHPIVEEILQSHQHVCGGDLSGYQGYRGHVYRMLNFCRVLFPQDESDLDKFAVWPCRSIPTAAPGPQEEEVLNKFAVAAAFHDLHVFESFDYLAPSAASAAKYLHARGKGHWLPEVAAMIASHHKLTAYRGEFAELVEPFRQADWIEMTFGVLRFLLPLEFVRAVRRTFPIRSFYPGAVLRSASRWLIRHPLNPAPYYPTRRKVAAVVRAGTDATGDRPRK
jgi:hypothetical protein